MEKEVLPPVAYVDLPLLGPLLVFFEVDYLHVNIAPSRYQLDSFAAVPFTVPLVSSTSGPPRRVFRAPPVRLMLIATGFSEESVRGEERSSS